MTTHNWQEACKAAMEEMLKAPGPDNGPEMAYMDVRMVAQLRNESEEQALLWLKSEEGNRTEDQENGLWLVSAKPLKRDIE